MVDEQILFNQVWNISTGLTHAAFTNDGMCWRGFDALDYGSAGHDAVFYGLYAVSDVPYAEGGSSRFVRYVGMLILNQHLESVSSRLSISVISLELTDRY